MPFTITSPSFDEGAPIPARHSADGGNISPALDWSGAPSGTESYALLVSDPDAPQGTVHHWAVCDIPVQHPGVVEGQDAATFTVARNVHHQNCWTGPKPPPGHGVHHYHFKVAALDVPTLPVTPDMDAAAMWRAAEGHVVAEAELIGTFETRPEQGA